MHPSQRFSIRLVAATILALAFAATPSNAAALNDVFTYYADFPEPAPGSYGVAGCALPDGRLCLWNGDEVYVQRAPRVDEFQVKGSGYVGDPSFAALSLDGHTVYLGAGGYDGIGHYGNIYAFDTAAPSDFGPESVALNQPHYTAAFLTEALLLIDVGTPSWTSELLVVDVTGAKRTPVAVVTKSEAYAGKDVVVEKPGYSSGLAVDGENGLAYAMDAASRELRSFSVASLINAYQTSTPLDWATDGTLIGAAGDYYTGGVAGITPDGDLVIGGSEGYLLPGGVQVVDPVTGDVLQTLDPSGIEEYTAVIYNDARGSLLVMAGGVAYVNEALATLPAVGGMGLALLGGLLILAVRRR